MLNRLSWSLIRRANGRYVSKALVFVAAAATSASYALDSFHHLQTVRQSSGAIIRADQKSNFLAYAKRRQPISRSPFRIVSAGDALPDSGLTYYDIPLSYGLAPFRFTVIGSETVIVDPTTSRAVEVID